VYEIQQSECWDFGKIVKDPLVMRNVVEDCNKFNWHNIFWLRYYSSIFGKILYKTSLSEEESFKI